MLRRGAVVDDPGLSNLRAYWEALRGDDPVPRRAQVDPRGIERALGIAFLAERVAPEVARFRVAGMRVNALMGMEVRGMPVSALFQPDARATLGRAIRRVFDGPAIAEMTLRGAPGLTQPRLEGRMLLLPLRSDDGSVSRVLGGLSLSGTIGSAPRRLDVTGMQLLPIGNAAGWDGTDTSSDGGTPLGMAEAPAPFAPENRGRPHLRVVRNDD
ncbi:PAS domain-containing protein [Rhodobaculum claviforme]|nr:PAS domain-containing protein [Rhodobaculum claviforme]